jgi:replication initiation protein RepC
LGLKATSIAILRAMISFMSADRISDVQDDHHLVYASNAALAERANVSIQTVERHVSLLTKVGLIVRFTASNGKRWVRRNRAGEVTFVSGLSLLPLVTRHAELTALASDYRRKQEELEVLRDKCTLAIARLQQETTSNIRDLMHRAKLILRRRPQQSVLQDLLAEIASVLSVENSSKEVSQPIKLTGRNDESEGHKEPSLNHDSKIKSSSQIEVRQDQIERAFPRLCSEIRFARDQAHCDRLMDNLANQLALGQTWYAMKSSQSPAVRFLLLGYLLQKVDTIKSPRAYFSSLLGKIEQGNLEPVTLMNIGRVEFPTNGLPG